MVEKGTMILVELTGRLAETGRVFETTDEKTAKENGLHHEGHAYKPLAAIAGEGYVIPGLDEALLEMKEEEKRHLELAPEKAFGPRDPKRVGIVPLKEFHKREIQPFVGLVVDLNGQNGRVQSVSGGRVRVDFNSDLAGKSVTYDIRIAKVLSETGEQVSAWADKLLPGAKAALSGEKATITLPDLPSKERAIVEAAMKKELQKRFPKIKEWDFANAPKAEKTAPETGEKHAQTPTKPQ